MEYLTKPAVINIETWNKLGDVNADIIAADRHPDDEPCSSCGEAMELHGLLNGREVLCPGKDTGIIIHHETKQPYRSIPKAAIDEALLTRDELGTLTDGYHTFNELYAHRNLLFLTLATLLASMKSNCRVTKSRKNSDGSSWDGWFVITVNLDGSEEMQLSYHLPDAFWDSAMFEEEEVNSSYDGHTSQDVLGRLQSWVVSINEFRKMKEMMPS